MYSITDVSRVVRFQLLTTTICVCFSSTIHGEEEFHCKPKPGCHITKCDPVPWTGQFKSNEFPITCEMTQTEDLRNLMSEVHELKQEVQQLRNVQTDVESLTKGFHDLRKKLENIEGSIAKTPTAQPKDLYTCKQLQKYDGTTVSGIYTMTSQTHEYKVHCDFSSGRAITEVRHTSMQEIKATAYCKAGGCYSWSPEYEIDANSILKIIQNSRECRQYIKVRCKGVKLLRGDTGWWVSRQGEKMRYWGGATSRRAGYCACGETGSCVESGHKCNCDQNNDSHIVQDDGFLTDKSRLPVRQLRFGDMNDFLEESWHTLGKLECTGQA